MRLLLLQVSHHGRSSDNGYETWSNNNLILLYIYIRLPRYRALKSQQTISYNLIILKSVD